MEKLISMTEFVLQQGLQSTLMMEKGMLLCNNYANFLNQPLKLGMFIPCDENDNVLEEPKRWKDYLEYPESFDGNKEWEELYTYQEAKERVLFDTLFEEDDSYYFRNQHGTGVVEYNPKTKRFYYGLNFIQDLCSYDLTLTQTALKQIGHERT